MQTTDIHWQKNISIEIDTGLRCQITTLRLELFRSAKEWLICWDTDLTGELQNFYLEKLETGIQPSPECNQERYVVKNTSNKVRLIPKTADRSVVIRPREPFILPSHEEATLFVSTPLWIEVAVDEPQRVLKELPVKRPSDTWFGPSLLKGDLCYDSRTRGVLDLDHLDYHFNRIITPLLIRNLAETPLTLERVSLPVPLLSVYLAKDNKLWTEAISMTREEDGEMAALKISDGAPVYARKAIKIAAARNKSEANTFVRAFGGFFS